MPTIDESRLSKSVRLELIQLMASAGLPARLPWTKGAKVTNLANTGSHHDRFNDGKFRIDFCEESWTFDGHVDEHGAAVSWAAEIDTSSGDVIARPTMLTRKISGSTVPQENLGIGSRRIGTLGRLEQLFPPNMADLCEEYGLPNLYGHAYSVRQDTLNIIALCKDEFTPDESSAH